VPRHVPIFGLASLYILFRSRSGDLRSEVGVPTLKSGHTRTARRWLKVSDYSAHASASPGKLPRNEPTQESYPWSRGFLFTEHPPSFKGQCRWQGGQTVFRKCNRIQNSDTRHPRISVATNLSWYWLLCQNVSGPGSISRSWFQSECEVFGRSRAGNPSSKPTDKRKLCSCSGKMGDCQPPFWSRQSP